MLITPLDLENGPHPVDVVLPPGTIEFGDGGATAQTGPLTVEGQAEPIEEHRGPREIVLDIRLRAKWAGKFEAVCARCVEPVEYQLSGEFDLIFRPQAVDADGAERAITAAETEIGYYEERGLLLEDVLREQVWLTLPVRSLCQPDCKGLCPHCGRNQNLEKCNCAVEEIENPRWNALSDLSVRLKSEQKEPG
jgi:uncharacterized protein